LIACAQIWHYFPLKKSPPSCWPLNKSSA
jgi:hypothetical protein